MKKMILLVSAVLLIVGCEGTTSIKEQRETRAQNTLPPGATNVTKLGNQWYTFDVSGRSFMIRVNGRASLFTELDI